MTSTEKMTREKANILYQKWDECYSELWNLIEADSTNDVAKSEAQINGDIEFEVECAKLGVTPADFEDYTFNEGWKRMKKFSSNP